MTEDGIRAKEHLCPKCGGLGRTNNLGIGLEIECDICHGTGKEEITNEENIRTCSTEELEHALTMLIMKDRYFADKEFAYVNIRFGVHCWLKEKHNG